MALAPSRTITNDNGREAQVTHKEFDLTQYPNALEALKNMFKALEMDGIKSAGLVLCVATYAVPSTTLVLTALQDSAVAHTESGQPIGPLMALLEAAGAAVRNHMTLKGD